MPSDERNVPLIFPGLPKDALTGIIESLDIERSKTTDSQRRDQSDEIGW